MSWWQKYGGIIASVVGLIMVLWALTMAAWVVFGTPENRVSILVYAAIPFGAGILNIYLGAWENIMKLGVVERIRERRRIAAAAATLEKYAGIDLLNSPEAAALPVPKYACSNDNCAVGYARYAAASFYWVDAQPLLQEGWYCEDCLSN